MSALLEKALVALLNEDADKANEYFHQFVVERARQIHEANRSGDEFVLEENWEQEISSEHYFTEEDLTDLEDGDGDEDEDAGFEGGEADVDAGVPFGSEEEGGEEATDELGDDLGVDGAEAETDEVEGEAASVEDRLDDIQTAIDDMLAKFDSVMAEYNGGEDADADVDDIDTDLNAAEGDIEGAETDVADAEDDADELQDDMSDTDEDDVNESEEEDDEFDDINESVLSELQAIKIALADGKEIGDGPSLTQNKGASIPQKNKDARQGGAPVQVKSKNHSGFAREASPHADSMKEYKNNKAKAPSMEKISKEGNKPGAEVNKLKSDGNNKSPLAK